MSIGPKPSAPIEPKKIVINRKIIKELNTDTSYDLMSLIGELDCEKEKIKLRIEEDSDYDFHYVRPYLYIDEEVANKNYDKAMILYDKAMDKYKVRLAKWKEAVEKENSKRIKELEKELQKLKKEIV